MKELREQKGFSSIQFSKITGIHPSHLSKIENCEGFNPRLKTLKTISNALNVSIDELFYEKEVA